jgi:hypothetical protein
MTVPEEWFRIANDPSHPRQPLYKVLVEQIDGATAAIAEIQRLQAAKRRALEMADLRTKENVELRARLKHLVQRWRDEAGRHRDAQNELSDDEDEYYLHQETIFVLERCAAELEGDAWLAGR